MALDTSTNQTRNRMIITGLDDDDDLVNTISTKQTQHLRDDLSISGSTIFNANDFGQSPLRQSLP